MAGQAEPFHANLRRLRQAGGLSQREVAATIGVSRRAVHDYEAGTYRPRTQVWLALRKLLGDELEAP
jgi:predicted transcriptional regulator